MAAGAGAQDEKEGQPQADKVQELLEKASQAHRSKNLAEAEAQYRQLLALSPKHAEACHLLGALLIQQHGKSKYPEAVALLKTAVNEAPSSAKYRASLGMAHVHGERWSEAADALERANEKEPMNVQTLMHLAKALRELQRYHRAAEVYRSVTLLQPDHPAAHYRRGHALRAVGKLEEAAQCFRQHLKLHPDDTSARFWVAASSGDASAMAAMPAAMVAGLFDQYSDNFDHHLVNLLQYRTPQALRDALLDCSASKAALTPTPTKSPHWSRAVDLGCGTGLMGPLLRDHVGWLEGVDLSGGMVDKARARGCYDRLEVGGLLEHLQGEAVAGAVAGESHEGQGEKGQQQQQQQQGETVEQQAGRRKGPYDLLVAADVFVYIGKLEPIMEAAARVSQQGALFAFSTEAVDHPDVMGASGGEDPTGGVGYKITPSGRYAHTRKYLQGLEKAGGWKTLLLREEVIRFNAGKPVHGYLSVMQLEEL